MTLKVLYLIALLDNLGMGLLLPLISPHVIKLGGSLSWAGILSSFSSAATLISSPIVGSWSDTRGRKVLLLSTSVLILLSNILAGISSLSVFFISRIIYATAHHSDLLIKAIVADTVPKETLNDVFNKLLAIIGAAFVIAPVLGGAVYESLQNFGYISIILCVLDILTLSVTFLFLDVPLKKAPEENKQNNDDGFLKKISADISKIFLDLKNVDYSKYGDLLTVKFLLESSFSLLFMNFGLVLMKNFNFSRVQLGLSIAYLSVTMISCNFLAVLINKKFYSEDKSGLQRIFHGYLLLAISFCFVPFADTAVLYLASFIPLSVAKMLVDATWMEILTSKTTEKDKGIMMGAAASMMSLSKLICPLIGGFVADLVSIHATTVLPILPSFVGVYVVYKIQKQSTSIKND